LYALLILSDPAAFAAGAFVVGRDGTPSAEWIARQLTEACGWSEAPRYIIRDRDGAYGEAFIRRLTAMGIPDRPISARSFWQNRLAERLIGSIRRDRLDHVVILVSSISAICSPLTKNITTRVVRTYRRKRTRRFRATPRR
jgi:hypothetical protein